MITKLNRTGNSLGLIIEQPILDQLNIDETTTLEVSIEGDALIVRPVRDEHRARVRASAKRAMGEHRTTLSKLAQ